ncbi:MAG: hypothetical protein JO081_10820 [Alphaproteobacteria bacterium]|nr:hypothetical protein [Alphaproteobacteria bacterium]
MDWTKLLATVLGAAILALQGVNVHQEASINAHEVKIEKLQAESAKEIHELYSQLPPSIERQKRLEEMLNKLSNVPNPNQK